MIPDDNLGLIEAARAIAAGRRVDWDAIESSGTVSDSLKALLGELKVVADIAALHRSLPDSFVSDQSIGSSLAAVAADTVATPETAAWGSLRLLERIGQGAFGDVYRAWDPRLDREVALKLLKRRDSTHDSMGSLVIDEGRLLARVRHPNVVTVYGADRIEGRVGLWMEFVRGRTLEAVLRDHGPFGAQEATLIGLDLCRALSAVHRAGLIHRDIKAQNVMREAGGRIVLMDFGTGREDLGEMPVELAGTPLYLAPEIFAGAPASARSDIYSVGVLLYHLVTQTYPVKGRTVADIRDAHAQRRRSWLRDDRPDLPDRFIQAIERAIAFDPEERYESAGAMERALTLVVSASESADAVAVPDLPSSPGRPTASIRPRGAIGIGAAALAIAAVGVALMPASWRATILSGGGRSPKAPPLTAPGSSVVVHKVDLPPILMVGRPSLDGTLFSFADASGNAAVIDLTTRAVRNLTTDAVLDQASQYADFSVISPDNRFVAYSWSALDGKSELRVVDIDGKRPRVLLRSESIEEPIPVEWSRDGASILATLTRPDHSVQLALVSAESGAVHPIKELGTTRPEHASLSPDGAFVVYDTLKGETARGRDIFIVRADGSDERVLVEHPANDVDPVWTSDGRGILFVSDRSGTMDVWSLAVTAGIADGEPHLMHRNLGRMLLRGLTDSGSYYYYAAASAVDVYQAQLREGTVGTPERLPTSFIGSNISSTWSQDGRRLAYGSRRGLIGFDRNFMTLVIRDGTTGEEREFTPALTNFFVRGWSPDGRSVLVNGTDAAGKSGSFAIDAEIGQLTTLFLGGASPDWRADGRVVYLHRASGTLIARTPPGGAEERLADLRAEGIDVVIESSGRGFKLAPDGQALAYTTRTGTGDNASRTLNVKMVGGGPARELARASGFEKLMFQDWMPDGQTLLFTRWTKASEPTTLWRVSIHGGDPQPLGLSMVGIRDVSAHPDGTRITFTAGWPKNELWVLDNLFSGK